MHIIREIAPDDVPLIIQAELDGDKRVLPNTIKVFPIIEDEDGGTQISSYL